MSTLPISLDPAMLEQIAREFDLRAPNKEGLRKLIFHLTGQFDPLEPLVLDMATGAGKTYLMAAAVEYFRRQGLFDVMVVTPSLVVQNKTVQNFSEGTRRYVGGFQIPPAVVSPQSYDAWRQSQSALESVDATDPSMVFIFNVQQLVAPRKSEVSKTGTMDAQRTRIRKFQEDAGSLYEYLTELEHLIVIADESHLYGTSAKAFNAALKELRPAATIGLTASTSPSDNIIYRYPLHEAIADGFVKSPVLVYRRSGYQGDRAEERQLRDALSLLRNKEAAYSTYRAAHPEAPGTKPALFVVCANVDHATQTAELLRGVGYCNSDEAVLQVDNEHDDEITRAALDELDLPRSRVRVVVSVDKLKEGWDTKRIAVLCTLRAMASEVLTQQTMGRGLRLPFGSRTGVGQIDQLDILAHTSFEELLNDENILRTFGLEGAVDHDVAGADLIASTPTAAATAAAEHTGATNAAVSTTSDPADDHTDTVNEPTSSISGSSTSQDVSVAPSGAAISTTPSVQVHELADDEVIDESPAVRPVTIRINPTFAGTTFLFPSTTMQKTSSPFRLVDLDDAEIEAAARRVVDSAEVLYRKELVASADDNALTTKRVEDAEVESARVDKTDVIRELTRRVVGLRQFTQSPENITQLKSRIVPFFVRRSPITTWTEKAKTSAVAELERLILGAIRTHGSSTRTQTIIKPISLPIDEQFDLPIGEEVLALLDESEQASFQLRKYYGDWEKGLFPAASFDSWSAEYLLALTLNYSGDIVWWKRLHRSDGASIAYSTRDNYYPDFVARDTDGVTWIIEGKSDKGRDDDVVEAKRKAAVSLVNQLIGDEPFKDTAWGYLIAYETDVKTADSWSDLKRIAQPTVTEGYAD